MNDWTRTCVVCGEDIPADAPGWTQCDSGWVCVGCNDAVVEGASVYAGESDGYESTGGPMDAWHALGDMRGKN